jgi:arylsulfatase A-like enzyme
MNRIFRGTLWHELILTALVFLAFVPAQAQTNANRSSATNRPPAPRRPNILLILADNIGYGDLGCYGQTKIKTPHLDQLASDGMRFTSYYVGSPNDEPSRASLLTGLQSEHVGASFSHPLPSDAFTVAMMLQQNGYHTGLIGEWNLGDTPPVQPNAKGFNEFTGFLSASHAHDYFTDSIYRQDTSTGSNSLGYVQPNFDGAHGQYVPDLLGTVAVNFLKDNQPGRLNHYQSFFLCLSYPIPHTNAAPADSIYSAESWPQPEKDRASMITHMDESIGSVLDSLAQLKLDTNTVVIFTSIGGPRNEGGINPKFFNSAGPLRGEAGSVYESGIRVPMIVRWPARIKPGQVSDFTWAAWDFLPTAAEIAFMDPLPKKTDGISIVPMLTGKGKAREHESLRWDSHEDGPQKAVRTGDWKLVRIETNAPELYNLKTDIGEREDIAAKNADLVKRMQELLGSSK